MIPDHFPDDETGAALRRLATQGSDLARPMSVDFHVAVPDEQAGRRVAEQASASGFLVELTHDPESRLWTCDCSKTLIATHAAIRATERFLDGLSAPFGGGCEGWGSLGNRSESKTTVG